MLQRLRNPYVLLMLALVFAGWWFLGKSSEQGQKTSSDKPAFKVVVAHVEGVHRTQFLRLTGKTQAARSIDVKARTQGTIEKLFVKEGDVVPSGKTLLKIAEEDRAKKLDGAKALVAEKQARYEVSKRLSQNKHRSLIDLAAALTELEKAKAYVIMAEIELGHTRIKAPFKASVEKIFLEKGSALSAMASKPLMRLVELDPLHVVVHVNERFHASLMTQKEVKLSWGGYPDKKGHIIYIAPVADPHTRTFEVKIALENKDYSMPGGMTTQVELPVSEGVAHQIDPGSLIFSDDGVQGVKAVDDQSKVYFYPIEIVESSAKSLWVRGLPSSVNVIIVGQGFVRTGDTVESVHKKGG